MWRFKTTDYFRLWRERRHILAWFLYGCLEPGAIAGAGFANNRVVVKRFDKPEAM
jgi:hypothetical protein